VDVAPGPSAGGDDSEVETDSIQGSSNDAVDNQPVRQSHLTLVDDSDKNTQTVDARQRKEKGKRPAAISAPAVIADDTEGNLDQGKRF
jgi:hypothetical protein